MLDINRLRTQPDEVRRNLTLRGDPRATENLERVIALDQQWRRALQELEQARRRRNEISRTVADRKRQGQDATEALREAAATSGRIAELEKRVEELRAEADAGLMRLPNLLHASVPPGKDASENVEVRRWGRPRKITFDLKAHGELLEALGLADFERARKVAGAGFNYLKGPGALLDQALIRFALEFLVKKGFIPIEVPEMLNRPAYAGMVDLADFENVMYKVQGEDLYLIATSEHPIGAMYMGEVLDEVSLPQRFAGISVNFRKEIGGHGVDTKGIFRMHQFNKVEQFVFSTPEESWPIHEELVANAEAIYKRLGVPYRVINLCSGDTGKVMAKTYDIEAWSPRQGKYVEVGSISNAADFQARRLNIRVGKVGGEKRVAHTLNGTAMATSRAMVAILENFQNSAGGFDVPRVLQPLMGNIKTIGAATERASRPKAKKLGAARVRRRIR